VTRFHGTIEPQPGRLRVRYRSAWTPELATRAAVVEARLADPGPLAVVAGVAVPVAAARELARRRAKLTERLAGPPRG
jgi:hypothetical protein